MKKIALFTCVVLLTGCTATAPDSADEGGNQPTTTSTSSSSRAAFEVSDAATCQTLIGTDGGLVSESGQFLTDVSELSDATAAEAVALADALKGVADTASEQFRDLLAVMQEPFRDLIDAHENGDTFSLDPSRFKAAGNEVIAICDPLMQESAATDTGAKVEVPVLDSCLALFGSGKVALDAEEFLSNVKSLDAETAREASILDARLGEVALTAEPELADPIEDMQVIFQDFVQGWEDSSEWSLDTEGYDAVVDQIKPICTAELGAATAAKSEPAETLTEEEQTEQAFLKSVRTAHPNLENFDDADLVTTAQNFCLIYSKPGGDPVVDELITKAAGLKYSLRELESINYAGVNALCPEHADKLG